MNGTTIAALGIVLAGLGGCAWTMTSGPRQDRVATLLVAALVVCLSLVLISAAHTSVVVLDLALLAGVAGPMATVVVAARGRGLGPRGGGRRWRRPGSGPEPDAGALRRADDHRSRW